MSERRATGQRGGTALRDAGSRRSTSPDRVVWRDTGSRRSAPSDRIERRNAGPRGDARYKEPRSNRGSDARMRDSGRRNDAPVYGSRRQGYQGQGRRGQGYGGRGDSYGYSRPYYTGGFHRPQYLYRSGFSLGFVIGSAPAYGYRYFDPYCELEFDDLDMYYDHCHEHTHAEAILVLEFGSDDPFASCVYDGGQWVVDDCY